MILCDSGRVENEPLFPPPPLLRASAPRSLSVSEVEESESSVRDPRSSGADFKYSFEENDVLRKADTSVFAVGEASAGFGDVSTLFLAAGFALRTGGGGATTGEDEDGDEDDGGGEPPGNSERCFGRRRRCRTGRSACTSFRDPPSLSPPPPLPPPLPPPSASRARRRARRTRRASISSLIARRLRNRSSSSIFNLSLTAVSAVSLQKH